MTILQQYNEMLDQRAAQEHEKAMQAKSKGDERAQSIHLMIHSMLGDMLKTFGRVQYEGARPGILAEHVERLKQEEARQLERGDFDLADRAHVKAETIAWAQRVLEELMHE